MATTNTSKNAASSSTGAVRLCAFLSILMILFHLAANPRSEQFDSTEKLQVMAQEFEKAARDVSPSLPAMLNFTWLDGSPQPTAWIDLYWVRKLHFGALPVVTWLSIAPFQVSSKFRTTYPQWHRRMGYLFFASSTCLCIGLSILIASGKVLGYPHWLALSMNTFKWSYFVASLILAFRYAVQRKLALHQLWITRHLMMGYTVSFQRILLIIVGPILHAHGWIPLGDANGKLSSKELQIWYNFTTLTALMIPLVAVEMKLARGDSLFGPKPVSMQQDKKKI